MFGGISGFNAFYPAEVKDNPRPPTVVFTGFQTSAIEEMLERVADSSGIVFDVQLAPLDGVFPPEHEINFYRIVQESVNNILKHSGATSASVIVKKTENGVELLIQDNGKGFLYDESGTISLGSPGTPGFGLKGMAERARILGGRYEAKSAPGQGTTIVVQIEKQNARNARKES